MDLKVFDIPQTVLENECLLLQELYMKGDDIQKLSVIQALPQLLQYDPNGTLTRIVPKIQQELPKSSCEFHLATSKIFKLLIEKQLPLNLTSAVIHGTESKDPVVSNSWIETLLAVIPVLPVEQIKTLVIPTALAKSQPSSPVYCRVASCKIFGKCAAHPNIQSIDVKTSILPAVQSLCQDCFQDVRATMCSQLHFVAQGLGENLVKTSLLPSLVELASDDNVVVRSAAVASAVLIIPYLNKQTKIETIVPLIKQLYSKTTGAGDATFPTIAREFGKLIGALQNDLDVSDCIWILQLYKTLATKGQAVRLNKDNLEVTQDVLCREQCAFNLPSVTGFTMARIPNQLELWHSVFSGLANDSCYIVRKTTAACVYDVAKILGSHCKIIKDDVIKLLRDDAEEVLHMLVPHVGSTLDLLCVSGVLSRETSLPSCLEITRALLKCHLELSKCYNWRIRKNFLVQIEQLPNCMPSDFIHQHFSPVVLNCILEARPRPVRSQATRTLLVFLRYNLKEIQRKWLRDNLISNLCHSKSCYTRYVFIMACGHAAELFSNTYFKKHFFEPLLSLADDPISNIRLSVVQLLPMLYKMLVMPEDRKLQTNIDNIFSKLDMMEKDRDVRDILKVKLKEIRNISSTNKNEYLTDQKRKEEEENKVLQGKMITGPLLTQAKNQSSTQVIRDKELPGANRSHPIISRPTSAPPRIAKSPSAVSNQPPSDMSFLEQHFYIDAGVNLPRDDDTSSKLAKSLDVCKLTDSSGISTVSAENINVETMSETELENLEISTTNITDDVKVNLRRRSIKNGNNCKSHSNPMKHNSNANKRFSSVFPTSSATTSNYVTNSKSINRRSLNIGAGDSSKIPVCIKKSQSNAEIKSETRRSSNDSNHSRKYKYSNIEKSRPKSEIFLMDPNNDNGGITTIEQMNQKPTQSIIEDAINDSINRNNVPITSSINKLSKTSGLPVLKKKTQSDVRTK